MKVYAIASSENVLTNTSIAHGSVGSKDDYGETRGKADPTSFDHESSNDMWQTERYDTCRHIKKSFSLFLYSPVRKNPEKQAEDVSKVFVLIAK